MADNNQNTTQPGNTAPDATALLDDNVEDVRETIEHDDAGIADDGGHGADSGDADSEDDEDADAESARRDRKARERLARREWSRQSPENWQTQLNIPGYQISKLVMNSGGRATIFFARPYNSDQVVVMKLLRPVWHTQQRPATEDEDVRLVRSWIHPNIVHIHDWLVNPDPIYHHQAVHVMEFCNVGDLQDLHQDLLSRRLLPNPAFVTHVMASLAHAVDYLHNGPVDYQDTWIPLVHRDLRPDNIFLCSDAESPFALRVKLGDLDLLRPWREDEPDETVGVPSHRPPEMLSSAPPIDMWAIGATLHFLLHDRAPRDLKPRRDQDGVDTFANPNPVLVEPVPRSEYDDLIPFMALLLETDPSYRTTATAFTNTCGRVSQDASMRMDAELVGVTDPGRFRPVTDPRRRQSWYRHHISPGLDAGSGPDAGSGHSLGPGPGYSLIGFTPFHDEPTELALDDHERDPAPAAPPQPVQRPAPAPAAVVIPPAAQKLAPVAVMVPPAPAQPIPPTTMPSGGPPRGVSAPPASDLTRGPLQPFFPSPAPNALRAARARPVQDQAGVPPRRSQRVRERAIARAAAEVAAAGRVAGEAAAAEVASHGVATSWGTAGMRGKVSGGGGRRGRRGTRARSPRGG